MKKFFGIVIILALMVSPQICGATEIQDAKYTGDFQFVYPEVKISNTFVNTMINEKIREEVKELLSTASQPDTSTSATMTYEITCDDKNILSMILTEVVYPQFAAHPSTFKRALNFDTRTGKPIRHADLKKFAHKEFTPKEITRKLKAHVKANDLMLYNDFKDLEALPDNFYFDENLHVHFIFQQYDVAPYAVGIIDLDTTLY